MPPADVSSASEQAMPPVSPSARPAERASITSGTTPVPITTISASIVRPDSVTTRSTRSSPSKRATASPPSQSMPCSRSSAAKNSPAARPKPSDSGSRSAATSVQRLPCAVSEAATSQAM